MSEDEHTSMIVQWFDALNKADLAYLEELADAFFGADFIWHDPRMAGNARGPSIVKSFIRELFEEYNGIQASLHDIFSAGDKVAYRFSVSMTEAASGKQVNLQLLCIDRFHGGQIVEEWQLSAAGSW